MASLREVARDLLYDAQDAISWLVIWKEGRSWHGESFYEIEYENDSFHIDEDRIDELIAILKKDPNAIAVNGYYCNIGPIGEDMTIQSLMDGIRFQYDDGGNLINILTNNTGR